MTPNRPPSPVLARPSRAKAAWGLSLAAALAAGCGGGLGHRSVANVGGRLEIGPGIRLIRLEIQNGTLDIATPVDAADARVVSYQGGVRRAANTAEELAAIEAVAIELAVVPDPARPDVLTVRGPHVPGGLGGVIGFEAGIRVPADMPLEIAVSGNGHVTMVGRAARSKVDTGRGDLRFENCTGGVEATTGQGVLIAFGHRGDLDVRTGNGDMQAFVENPGANLILETGRGTVQCHVPETLEFEVDARAQVGRISSDFGLTVEKVGDYSAAMVGRRGAGTTRILLRTASGHLYLIPRKFD